MEDAVEVDVDAIADGTVTVIGGIMEHIEAAGVRLQEIQRACCRR
ncbi:MAG: hypothetical protein R2860_16610 [Desulfobacterales bacterium]